MFNIGDLVIYSAHGICKIDDICDKTVAGKTRKYYVLHPIENNHQLTISTPVNNKKNVLHELMDKEEALEILKSFQKEGIEWDDRPNPRLQSYSKIVSSGDRTEIAEVVNTLIRKQIELEQEEKQLYAQDLNLLTPTQHTLFKELSIALATSVETINKLVITAITEGKAAIS